MEPISVQDSWLPWNKDKYYRDLQPQHDMSENQLAEPFTVFK